MEETALTAFQAYNPFTHPLATKLNSEEFSMAEEISTPVAFIQGRVEVNGIPPSSTDQVYVYAQPQGGGQATQTNMQAATARPEDKREYCLTVAPGVWTVWSQLGPVISKKTNVTVAAAQSAELDFSFGADKD